MRVLIPALGRADKPEWGDLLVLCTSIQTYAPHARVTVAWRGTKPPPVFVDKRLKQPQECSNFGEVVEFLIKACDEEEFLILNDDTIFTPDTMRLLEEDVEGLKERGGTPGLVGLRSNYVAGYQNVRVGFGKQAIQWESEAVVLDVPKVFGVAFWTTRENISNVPNHWLKLHWFGDDLLSYDLLRNGKRHYVSRAYVHHHGSRSGKDYERYHKEGMEWLQKYRPDYLSALPALGSGPNASVYAIGTPEMWKSTGEVPKVPARSVGAGYSLLSPPTDHTSGE